MIEREEPVYEEIEETIYDAYESGGTEDTWSPVSWYCPNCGAKTTAYRKADGTLRVACANPLCQVLLVRKDISRRHKVIEVYASRVQAY